MNWLLRLFLIPGRVRHRWENRKRIKITRGLIETLRKHCQDAEKYGFKNHAVVYNAALFVVLLEQDLSAYSEALYYLLCQHSEKTKGSDPLNFADRPSEQIEWSGRANQVSPHYS
jgi:hypothetical protein